MGETKIVEEPTLLLKDPSICFLNCGERIFSWSPDEHQFFSESFRKIAMSFLFCLHNSKLPKLPKYLKFEILKYLAEQFEEEENVNGGNDEKKCIIN